MHNSTYTLYHKNNPESSPFSEISIHHYVIAKTLWIVERARERIGTKVFFEFIHNIFIIRMIF